MFDSDPKRGLKRRANSRGKSQTALGNRETAYSPDLIQDPTKQIKPLQETNTIFEGLKLTETLFNELTNLKAQFDSLHDQIETGKAERELLRKKLRQ